MAPIRCVNRTTSILIWWADSPDAWESSVRIRPLVSWRGFIPSVAGTAEFIAELEQFIHVVLVEWLLERHVEGCRNESQIEVDPVPLGRRVDAVEVPDALILDQRRYRSPGDRKGFALRIGPIRVEARVANYEGPSLSFDAGLLRQLL